MPAIVSTPPVIVIEQHANPQLDLIGEGLGQTPLSAAEQEAALQRGIAEAGRANREAVRRVEEQAKGVASFEQRARNTLSELMKDMEPRHDREK